MHSQQCRMHRSVSGQGGCLVRAALRARKPTHAMRRGPAQVIGYDMDYTCVNYNVEAWEGRAYSYGMQARCGRTPRMPAHRRASLVAPRVLAAVRLLP